MPVIISKAPAFCLSLRGHYQLFPYPLCTPRIHWHHNARFFRIDHYGGVFVEKLRVYLVYSAALIGVFLFGGLIYASVQEDAVTVSAPAPEVTVIIDPGHGGEDGGAEANGLLEKNINLSVSLKLRDMLCSAGYNVVMTRDEDISVYDPDAKTVRQKKVSDMKNREKLINGNENNILISIHQNKFEQSKYSGTQIFYSGNNEKSAALAECLRRSVTGLIQPGNKRELKKDNGSIYLLKNAKVPAVIVECGFLSNPQEAEKLGTEKYQKEMAFAVFCGFLQYAEAEEFNKNG